MSLSHLIGQPDVKKKFKEYVKRPKVELPKNLLAPPLTKNYSGVGIAFDYLLRFCLERRYDFAIANKWVAIKAMDFLPESPIEEEGWKIIEEARLLHAQFIEDGELTDQLIGSCLKLSQLDSYARRLFLEHQLTQVSEDDVSDLKGLISIVGWNDVRATKQCYLNPDFGDATKLVHGADADLILDDTLIEIKTIKKTTLSHEILDQLVGYYLLYKIGGINGSESEVKITKLAVYFSRFGKLLVFDADEIIPEDKVPELADWLINKAKEIYKK